MTRRHEALAGRLVLAHLTHDNPGWDYTADDVGACPHCWQEVANNLASLVAMLLSVEHGDDEATAMAQRIIVQALDADRS